MRLRRYGSIFPGVSGAILLGAFLRAPPAHAQAAPPFQRGFALERLEQSERGSEWFALDSLDLRGKLRPAVGVTSLWSYHSLVAYDGDGNYLQPLVRHQVWVNPSASVVLFDRVRLGLNVPIAVFANGTRVVTDKATYRPPGGHFGDMRFSADARLFGRYGDAITLAVGSALYLPTGSRESYTSDGNTRFAPRVTFAGDIAPFVYSGRASFHYRPLDERFDRNPLGHQLELSAAAGLRVANEKLVVGPELFFSSVLDDDSFFKRRGTPVDLLLGAHYTAGDFRFGAGAGTGIARGWGSTAFRAVLSAEWAPAFAEPKPPPPPPPPIAEPPPPPPPIAEPPPPPPPPADRDGDAIPDDKDACPDLPGEASADALVNGCPPDRDGDGIYDKDDACVDAPGAGDPDPKKNGCPLARIENGQIRIADQVRFKSASAEILRESDPVILAVASTMKTHPEIKKVLVEGHTDATGRAATNDKLSQKRAEAVVAAVVRAGVDKKRLAAKGFGSTRPLDSNLTEEGKQANRRVELLITESGPP